MAQPPILSLENLGLQQGGRWLFGGPEQENIDLHIGPRDRLALIGRNGVGKSTLFRLIDYRERNMQRDAVQKAMDAEGLS